MTHITKADIPEFIEYRIRPVERFIVTRYERSPSDVPSDMFNAARGFNITKLPSAKTYEDNSRVLGEYSNENTAYEVAYALAKADHERKNWPVGDDRIKYPDEPRSTKDQPVDIDHFIRQIVATLDIPSSVKNLPLGDVVRLRNKEKEQPTLCPYEFNLTSVLREEFILQQIDNVIKIVALQPNVKFLYVTHRGSIIQSLTGANTFSHVTISVTGTPTEYEFTPTEYEFA